VVAPVVPEEGVQFCATVGHRKNILDKLVTHAGVGAARRPNGTLFLAQEFIQFR
jgi:uncharacterized protein YkwD